MRAGPPTMTVIVLVAALGSGLIVGSFGRYSWPATAVVVVLAALGLALAWGGPLRPSVEPGPLDPLGVLAWSSVFVALGLWELTSLLLQPSLTTDSYAHPTISVLMDPVLAGHVGRMITMFVWLAAGSFLVQQ
jgi:hypothetical protein